MKKKFGEHEAEYCPHPLRFSYRIKFENGYGASIVRGPFTYGGDKGLWELAVLKNDAPCYSSEIADDVIGYMTEEDVAGILDKIRALNFVAPSKKEEEWDERRS